MKINFAERRTKIIVDADDTDEEEVAAIRAYRSDYGTFRWDRSYRFWFLVVPDTEIDRIVDEVKENLPGLTVCCEV
jgi:hypothetical protein